LKTENLNKTILATLIEISLILSISGLQTSVKAVEETKIWTDKEDYAPGETAKIFGSGFDPNFTITISITRPDGSVETLTATSDELGGFVCEYQLDGIEGVYTVVATDGTNTASTTFTDGFTIAWVKSSGPSYPPEKDSFLDNEGVYAVIQTTGSGSKTVRIYVVENEAWKTGALVDVSGGYETVTLVATVSPQIHGPFLIWRAPTTPGGYDIVVDEDLDGIRDPGEKVDDSAGPPGFVVTSAVPPRVIITVTTSPSGLSIVLDNITYTAPQTFEWDIGSTHTIGTTSPQPGAPGEQYVWQSWSDGGAIEHSITVPSSPTTYTANFRTQYYLTVTSPYGTTGGEGWYDSGSTAYATVTPLTVPGPSGTQYVFTNWSGDATGTTSPSNPITMDGPKTAVANWKTQYYLMVRTNPTGIVTIPGEGWYDECTYVGLTAPSVMYYNFVEWTVDGVSQGLGVRSITVHMDGPHTAIAHYKRLVTRSQGFWATQRAYTWSKWTTETIGSKVIDTEAKLFGAFWSNIAFKTDGTQRTLLDQARMQLLQQLVAAMLNVKAFGDDDLSTGARLIAAGKAAFASTAGAQILRCANLLAAFNESGKNESLPPGVIPGPADPITAQAIANRVFWDNLP
jgi:uncharacterized repeat protein (TIGR02543 family)